ncbi:MAG: 6-bladed beta-propeller [Gemmatimonadota bacterium]|nr:6-bladed beta-propeller [Gemmatimonadota bacterium]
MRYVLLLLATMLLQHWTTPTTAQDYSLEKVREIPIDLGDEIVGQISDLARDTEGNFYLSDRQQHTVWVTDPSGKLIRRIGQEGSGPGEMSKPQNVTVFDDRIVVFDKENFRVATFNLAGVHQASFRIDRPGPDNIVCGSDERCAVSSLFGESLLTVYDLNGNKSHDMGSRPWPPDPPIPVRMGGSFLHMSLTPEGRILFSSIKTYQVYDMEWDGRIIATYSAEPSGYFPMVITSMETASEELNRSTKIFRPLVVGDLVLVQRVRNSPDNFGIRHIDLFERNGTLVQMDIESPLHFDYAEGDDLYAIDINPVEEGELNPSIVVYRLNGGP